MISKNHNSEKNVILVEGTSVPEGGVTGTRVEWQAFTRIADVGLCNGVFNTVDPTALLIQAFMNNPVAKMAVDAMTKWGKRTDMCALQEVSITPKTFMDVVYIAAASLSKPNPSTAEDKTMNTYASHLVEAARAFSYTSPGCVRVLMMTDNTEQQARLQLLQNTPATLRMIYSESTLESAVQHKEVLELLRVYPDIA